MLISGTALIIGSIISAVIGAGTSLGAQALQNQSQRETNQANADINAANNAFSAEMSNTAVQRRADDLEAAGFNRALAVTSPSGSTLSGVASTAVGSKIPMQAMNYSPMAQMANNLSSMVHSANSIIYLQKLANKNPQAMAALAGASKAMTRSVTSANRIPSMSAIERDLNSF